MIRGGGTQYIEVYSTLCCEQRKKSKHVIKKLVLKVYAMRPYSANRRLRPEVCAPRAEEQLTKQTPCTR